HNKVSTIDDELTRIAKCVFMGYSLHILVAVRLQLISFEMNLEILQTSIYIQLLLHFLYMLPRKLMVKKASGLYFIFLLL
ncbi:hypothetical protein ACJX0J_033628, partial [Zea mays]